MGLGHRGLELVEQHGLRQARRRPASGRRRSARAAPASTASTLRQSATLRAMAHTVSRLRESSSAPWRGTATGCS
jgi:hypothetical protein